MLADPGADLVLAIVLAVEGADFPEVRELFAGLRVRHPDKPLAVVMFGRAPKARWLRDLEGLQIPVYPTTRTAVRALAAAARQAEVTAGRQ